MSKLFYRLYSLIKYLKHNGILDTNYEPFIFKTEQDSVVIAEYKKNYLNHLIIHMIYSKMCM